MKRQETVTSLLAKLKVAWPPYEAALKAFGRAEEAEREGGAGSAKALRRAERRVRVREKRAMGLRYAIIATPARSLADVLAKIRMVQEGDFSEHASLVDYIGPDLKRLVGKVVPS